ncbi:SWI/SNF and RSC complex subunit Ssr1 [Yamadazyma tenuis]|uniref:SWI/SNF and RSC complex subunit Ssr1 n=1 Tax=Candida tenuis TaxID=2315449 RepID=UPI0027A152E7|nr:SWI/SNF and RSC complex subunit Ssr1 [Yamadazyma tenuis]
MKVSSLSSSVVLVLAAAQYAVATPPACLLACVSQVTKKSDCSALNDLSCICGTQYDKVEDCLNSICPEGVSDTAVSAFESVFESSSEYSSSEELSSTVADSSSEEPATSEDSTSLAAVAVTTSSKSSSTSSADPTSTSIAEKTSSDMANNKAVSFGAVIGLMVAALV